MFNDFLVLTGFIIVKKHLVYLHMINTRELREIILYQYIQLTKRFLILDDLRFSPFSMWELIFF